MTARGLSTFCGHRCVVEHTVLEARALCKRGPGAANPYNSRRREDRSKLLLLCKGAVAPASNRRNKFLSEKQKFFNQSRITNIKCDVVAVLDPAVKLLMPCFRSLVQFITVKRHRCFYLPRSRAVPGRPL